VKSPSFSSYLVIVEKKEIVLSERFEKVQCKVVGLDEMRKNDG
jgi:hypothetical protein